MERWEEVIILPTAKISSTTGGTNLTTAESVKSGPKTQFLKAPMSFSIDYVHDHESQQININIF